MCSNYVPSPSEVIKGMFRGEIRDYEAETYPGYEAPFVRGADVAFLRGNRELAYGRFGLVPHWTKPENEKSTSRRTYNARSETVAAKPSFKGPWARRQFCAIPVEAIYEPRYDTGKAVRWRIERADRGTIPAEAMAFMKQYPAELLTARPEPRPAKKPPVSAPSTGSLL
jgi:putative SOS response-associated peptidase YedK